MSKDIPIIFSGPMVRALLDGRKTMTRRHANRRAPFFKGSPHYRLFSTSWQSVQPGDRLWVRENFRVDEGGIIHDAAGGQMDYVDTEIVYAADTKRKMKLTPCIHMPRRYSRITLAVTAVKIERLQDINNDDAKAEGIDRIEDNFGNGPAYCDYLMARPNDTAEWFNHPVNSFESLWRSLHGKDAWDENPEVVALTFTVHKSNIDALPKSEAA